MLPSVDIQFYCEEFFAVVHSFGFVSAVRVDVLDCAPLNICDLPTFASLVESGRSSRMSSTIQPFEDGCQGGF
jgi:hypothetical protein